MKLKLAKIILYVFVLTKYLVATELTLELVDVPNLVLENEKTAQPTVFVGTPFQLKVTVKNGSGGSLQIQGLNKLKVVGQSQMNSTSFFNGATTIEQNHILNVVAYQEGNLTVGPAFEEQNGGTVKSNTVQVRAINRPQDSSKIKTESGAKIEKTTDNEEATCEIFSDKKSPFQGEPFAVTIKITASDQVAECALEQVNFPGFSYKEMGQQKTHQKLRNNRLVEIVEKRFALTALQDGQKIINPVTLIYNARVRNSQKQRGLFADDFFSSFFDQVSLQRKQCQSNSLKIDVKPLPKTDEPVDGIGTFKSIEISVDKNSALANEAIALTLSIEGSGNFDQISTPKLQLPDFIKNYESKNEFIPDSSLGAFGGKKKFEYVIQVSSTGDIKIPAQKFTFFDTNSKTYKTLNSNEITVSISQPVGEDIQPQAPAQAHSQEKKSSKLIKDIGFIEEDVKFEKSNIWNIPLWLFLLVLLIPLLLFAFFAFNIHKYLASIFLKSNALKIFHKKSIFAKFQKQFDELKKANQAEKIYGLFLCLLAAKFDVSTQSITSSFIEKELLQSGWDATRIDSFVDFLNACAGLHFITITQIDPTQAEDLFKKGQHWIVLLTSRSTQQNTF